MSEDRITLLDSELTDILIEAGKLEVGQSINTVRHDWKTGIVTIDYRWVE